MTPPAGPEDRGPFYHSPTAAERASTGIPEGDVEIGAVELKDATTNARAKVAAGNTIAAADIALAVKDHGTGNAADAKVDTDAAGTISAKMRGLVAMAKAWTRGAGNVTAETQRVTLAADDPAAAALGATTGAAVVADADGTIHQYLRGLVKRWADALGVGTAAAALRTTQASDSPLVAVTGATDGAAVVTDANGTVQQYLRGIVKRWFDALGAGTAAAALRTTEASDSPMVAVAGATTGAAVVTDVDGTIQQYLRGLVKALIGTGISLKASTAGGQGSKAVAAAATPEQLGAAQATTSIIITARVGNTKQVAIGWSNAVRATAGAEVGMQLQPGDTIVIAAADRASIWVDAQVNGEGVSYTYQTN